MKTNPATPARKRQVLALLAGMASAFGISQAQTINVNFEQFTPSLGTFEVESELEGPAGGLGTEWNQFADEDSAGPLVDSTGTATSVEFMTNFSEGRSGGGGNTPMMRSTLTDFGRGAQRTLTITGLTVEGYYNVWLVSFRDSSAARERTVGVWSTAHSTTSPSPQIIDNRSGRNGTSFVDGYNYVLFENVQADLAGQIVFDGKGATIADGYDDDYRLGLSGFQLEATTPPVAGDVDAAVSTVEASPDTNFADGTSTSTVTVTLKDATGVGVPGKEVTLVNSAGPQMATIDPAGSQTTNVGGVVTFSVSSATPGTEVFTATDVTDSNLVVTQTASVEFIEVGVLSDADMSTVVASPTAVLADGASTSTITVTLLDANGYRVSGKEVTLAHTFGPGTPVITPSGAQTTDASGEAVFTVSSDTVGVEEFSATDATDGIAVTQVAIVGFIDPNTPQMISVNFEQFTPALGTFEVESSLEGPAGGLNTAWNQFADEDSSGPLLDSLGATTTVEFTTDFSECRSGGGGNTPMLRSTLTDFGRGAQRTLTITGLKVDGYYNIWLASFRDSTSEVERTAGTWSTVNATTSPASQIIDNRSGRNGTTFEDGYNYVLFEHVQADGSGQIVCNGQGLIIDEPIDGNDYRLGLSGFQIVETEAPLAMITSFGVSGIEGVIDQTAKTITLDVPFGTDLATLAPEFVLTSGTCDQSSGVPPSPSFAAQNPVDYVVTDDSTDPDTVHTYAVTVNVAPQLGTIVIDLGAGTVIEGGTFGTYGATNLPLPALPAGSILKSIEVDTILQASDNENFASDLALLFDPTPEAPGGDIALIITNGELDFAAGVKLGWASGDGFAITPLSDTKTEADWTAAGAIDLGATGLFLGNAYGGPTLGGTWSGTITLTYEVSAGGGDYGTWAAGFLPDDVSGPGADFDGDGLSNNDERVFGLDPTDPASVHPFMAPLDAGAGTFSYTRRDPALTGLTYTIWTSPDLSPGSWTEDAGATEGTITKAGDVETVPVTLSATPVDGRLFVQVRAH